MSIPFQCGGDLTENYLMDKNGQPWCIFCLQKYVQQIRADNYNLHTTINYSQLLELLELL